MYLHLRVAVLKMIAQQATPASITTVTNTITASRFARLMLSVGHGRARTHNSGVIATRTETALTLPIVFVMIIRHTLGNLSRARTRVDTNTPCPEGRGFAEQGVCP